LNIEDAWYAVFGERLSDKRKSGPGQVRVLCPFHKEHNASCDVSLTKGAFCCRSCGASGGVLDLVVREGLAPDRRTAAAWLKAKGVAL
jgi:hypothetical protein